MASGARLWRTKSCGCLKEINRVPKIRKAPKVAATTILFTRYKRNAKERGYPWCLDRDVFENLVFGPCFYCGTEPRTTVNNSRREEIGKYNGVDRRDNSKGYDSTNAVSCCSFCNYAKRDRSESEFLSWLQSASLYSDKQSYENYVNLATG